MAIERYNAREAEARKEGAEAAADYIRGRDPQGRVWFIGHWGFQYYAEGRGMAPVIPNRSQLHRGDWLVIPGATLAWAAVAVTVWMIRKRI